MNAVLNDNEDMGIDQPEVESHEAETVEPVKRRGRKPRTQSTPTPEASPTSETVESKPTRRKSRKVNANSVQQIMGIHKMVSLMPGCEVFAIEESEAQILAEGMQGIADEYGVVMSGKTGATLNFIAALAMVYGPRGYYIWQQRKLTRMPPPVNDNVETFNADGRPIDLTENRV